MGHYHIDLILSGPGIGGQGHTMNTASVRALFILEQASIKKEPVCKNTYLFDAACFRNEVLQRVFLAAPPLKTMGPT
jgi:hypothetical protein